jgi:hypothetical protein
MQREFVRLLEFEVRRHLPAMPVTQEPKAQSTGST